jgi:DNA-binding beta-propeller fold protein YncE
MLQPRFLVQGIVPIIVLSVALMLVPAAVARHADTTVPADRPIATVSGPRVHSERVDGPTRHYEYVFPHGSMSVYDIDHGHRLVQQVSLPTTAGVRGVAASPMTHMLYISYGGDGGSHGNGSILAYNLLTDQVVWAKTYHHGIDSMAISPDGKTIYMPDGELSLDGTWYVVDAATGHDVGTINAGTAPHNTVVSLDGSLVFLGGRNYNYFEVASTKTNQVIKKVGHFKSGIRPFTVNGKNTLVYTSVTGFLGFQVGDITTGKVLYTVPIKGFRVPSNFPNFPASDPSHGISLSPDERELYVMDAPNSYVHVFDVSGVPRRPPVQVANIPMAHPMPGYEHPCAYDCFKDGWLQHSGDGRFVYVGDEGDVIDTARRRVVATLPALARTRKMLEIDWRNGVPVFTTTRTGLGYITNQMRPTSR